MNIKKINLIYVFYVLLLLSSVNFFSLSILPDIFFRINSGQQIILQVITSFVMVSFSIKKSLLMRKDIFRIYILWFWIISLFGIIYTINVMGQNAIDTLIASNYVLALLSYFPISLLISNNKMELVKKAVIIITLVGLTLIGIQYFSLKISNYRFMNLDSDFSRFGSVRITQSSHILYYFGSLLLFERYIKNKSNGFLLLFVYTLLIFLFVSKGRMLLIGLLVSCLCMYFYFYKKNIIKSFLFLLVLLLTFISFSNTSIGQSYLNSFSPNSQNDTASVRQREIIYYNTMSEESPIIGNGFLRDVNGSVFQKILRGPTLQYSRTDVGIFGLFNALGLLGISWYIGVVLYLVWLFIKYRRSLAVEDGVLLIGMLVTLVSFSFTMIMTDPVRIIFLSHILAFFNVSFRKRRVK